ncbi:MAG: hypothetical protein NDJ92_10420 [Thermoanaerobaculia bacterium]|nr:hypothetical protein [Thermoanaerobaculia bacterium]
MSDEPWLSIMFQEYDGIVSVTLPGYSSDECRALVEVYGRYPIWEERLVYLLRATDHGWEVEEAFPSHLQGE